MTNDNKEPANTKERHHFTQHEIKKAFELYDKDGSGDLDELELCNAIHTLFQRNPSTLQVMSMIKQIPKDVVSASRPTCLSLTQFALLVNEFDWNAPMMEMDDDMFEVVFPHEKLGFR
jgi:Ca2+-binding EF-hand superfamily protein